MPGKPVREIRDILGNIASKFYNYRVLDSSRLPQDNVLVAR